MAAGPGGTTGCRRHTAQLPPATRYTYKAMLLEMHNVAPCGETPKQLLELPHYTPATHVQSWSSALHAFVLRCPDTSLVAWQAT